MVLCTAMRNELPGHETNQKRNWSIEIFQSIPFIIQVLR